MSIKRIDVKRFNALAAHGRSPAAAYVSRKPVWFSNGDETLLATLLEDTAHGDFLGVLSRDEGVNDRTWPNPAVGVGANRRKSRPV